MDKISYRVVYSHRRPISITVNPDTGVTVRAPFMTSLSAIEKYIQLWKGVLHFIVRSVSRLEKHQGKAQGIYQVVLTATLS